MTKLMQQTEKAKSFIVETILKSEKTYGDLMIDLEEQSEKWRKEYARLSNENVFDITTEEYERKNYLDALITYSEKLVNSFKSTLQKKKMLVAAFY